MLIENSVIIVTGGLGGATARKSLEHGAYAVFADVNETEGDDTAKSLGARARFVHTDVTSEGSVAQSAFRPLPSVSKRMPNRSN